MYNVQVVKCNSDWDMLVQDYKNNRIYEVGFSNRSTDEYYMTVDGEMYRHAGTVNRRTTLLRQYFGDLNVQNSWEHVVPCSPSECFGGMDAFAVDPVPVNYHGEKYILIENKMLGQAMADRFFLFQFRLGQYKNVWYGYNMSHGVVHMFLNFDYNSLAGDFTTFVLEVNERFAKVVSKPRFIDFKFKHMKYVTMREVMFGAGLSV